MGLGVGDISGDGIPDFLISAWKNMVMLESVGSPVWYDTATLRGIYAEQDDDQWIAWGTELADLDNDADLDALVTFGYIEVSTDERWENPILQADAVFIQGTDGSFLDEGAHYNLDDDGAGRGFGLADINRDGWLDVVKPQMEQSSRVYISRCGVEAWLAVRVEAPAPNGFGIGTRVAIQHGDIVQKRTILAGGTNYASSQAPEAYFGLGLDDVIDEIEITWPSGLVSRFENVPARQHVTVVHPDLVSSPPE